MCITTGGLLLCCGLLGCQSRVVSANNPVAITAEEYDRMFEATVDVLRLNQFIVNRQDRRFGVVTTKPRVAASSLEPWWTDNTTAYQHVDATLNYQRRTVTVRLEPADPQALAEAELARVDVRSGEESADTELIAGEEVDTDQPTTAAGGDYQLRVEVLLEQRQLPEQQLHTAATGSIAYFGRSPDVRATINEEGVVSSFWRPVGRDVYLEQRLVRDILNRSTVVSPRVKSEEGPTDDDASDTPELIRPSEITTPEDPEAPEQP